MPYECPQEYIKFAGRLADSAGIVIRKYFRKIPKVIQKSDCSLVTKADMEAEKEIRRIIKQHYPKHGIIGEEMGNSGLNSNYVWTIDPIDGTSSFAIGRPIFGTLISLLYKDVPVLGIIDQPILGERWVGANGTAKFNGKKITVRGCRSLKQAILCTTSKDLFGNYLSRFEKVRKEVRQTVYGGDCYSYGLLASGHVDIVVESGLKIHDFCALAPIIEGAGGVFTDWKGRKITKSSDGNIIAAGTKAIHSSTMHLLV